MAGECFEWAREAQTEDERLVYLTLAQTWLEEAARHDGASQIRLPPQTVSKLAAIAIPTRYLGVWVRTVASRARGGNNRTHCFQLTRNCDLDPVPRSMGPEHASRARELRKSG
jgi:hypothetical protein